jgi:EAL domain-containing protein (putative c-di-GMP-specific phosphodiesterase class I)/FixJ family two-component response regulator
VIIVADDDQAIRALYRAALEREGYNVVTVTNGRRALEIARGNPVAGMLLDLNMPGLNGLETLQEVRADPVLRTLPVIIVTGSSVEAERMAGLELGADDVLTKPISVAELTARVRAQIRRHSALAQELATGREHRRLLAALLSELPRDAGLVALATSLADGLRWVVDVEGVAIVTFERTRARSLAASGLLRSRFPPTRPMPRDIGSNMVRQASTGPWLDAPKGLRPVEDQDTEMAFVPFALTAASTPIGCFVYATSDKASTPLAHRLANLIDATELTVSALRPAIEHAETTNAAIHRLRQVIGRRQFAIHLQPIVRLQGGEMVGVEALTRFVDAVRPDVRFAEAARLGLGASLERATLAASIEAASSLPSDVALSVNVSPDVLQHERSLPEIVRRANRPVLIELTEHERIDDYDAVRAAFKRLGPGVRLAVDDAGSGYASLRHILSLQPSYVKLDMAWVQGIERDPVRRSLVSGLTYFASAVGCQLIAEGIESEDERRALIELGVQLGQGYLLGRPAPIDAFSLG